MVDFSEVQPPRGNYGGSSATVGALLPDDGERQAQTSGLASAPGALLLDYLRVVLPDDRRQLSELAGWLGPLTVRPFGWKAWYDRSASVLEGGLVAWCSDRQRAESEGIMVDLPGRACACLGSRIVAFLVWCLERGHATRVDFAVDDRAGRLTRERILEAERSGGLVTHWKGFTEIVNRERGRVVGWTIYLGSRDSMALLRVYDKAGEQASRGKDAPAGSWVRCELEAKGAFADGLARAYFREGSSAVIGQIARRVRFIIPGSGDRTNRAIVAPWWASFLGSVAPGPSLLPGEKPQATIEAMKEWAERQVGPTLAAVVQADGGNLAWLEGAVDRGGARMTSRHYAALAALEGVRVVRGAERSAQAERSGA